MLRHEGMWDFDGLWTGRSSSIASRELGRLEDYGVKSPNAFSSKAA